MPFCGIAPYPMRLFAVAITVVEVHDQPSAVGYSVFSVEFGEGLFDGNFRNAHVLGNFPVGQPLPEQGDDEPFPGVRLAGTTEEAPVLTGSLHGEKLFFCQLRPGDGLVEMEDFPFLFDVVLCINDFWLRKPAVKKSGMLAFPHGVKAGILRFHIIVYDAEPVVLADGNCTAKLLEQLAGKHGWSAFHESFLDGIPAFRMGGF